MTPEQLAIKNVGKQVHMHFAVTFSLPGHTYQLAFIMLHVFVKHYYRLTVSDMLQVNLFHSSENKSAHGHVARGSRCWAC